MTKLKQIIKQIDELTKKYDNIFIQENELKALQGMERCIEMKVKVLGLDTKKTPPMVPENKNIENNISIAELPTELIEKLLLTIKNMKQQKQ